VVIRRRPDGIVQIRPRPLWRTFAGPVPASLLALLLLCAMVVTAITAALVSFPVLVLLLGGCATLALSAARWAFTDRQASAVPALRRPPQDAA
jgi:hypothetical protein